MKIRKITGTKLAVKGSSFTESLYRPTMQDTAQAILVEGESDAWCMAKWASLNAPSWTVYAMPTGAGCWRPEFMNQLSNLQTLRICLDQDKAGLEAEQTIWMSLEDKIPDIDKIVPEGGRVAEAFAAGWEPAIL
jgi:DNA primase